MLYVKSIVKRKSLKYTKKVVITDTHTHKRERERERERERDRQRDRERETERPKCAFLSLQKTCQ